MELLVNAEAVSVTYVTAYLRDTELQADRTNHLDIENHQTRESPAVIALFFTKLSQQGRQFCYVLLVWCLLNIIRKFENLALRRRRSEK